MYSLQLPSPRIIMHSSRSRRVSGQAQHGFIGLPSGPVGNEEEAQLDFVSFSTEQDFPEALESAGGATEPLLESTLVAVDDPPCPINTNEEPLTY
jgi:hypothetical protein